MELDQQFEPVSDEVSIPDKLLERTIKFHGMKLQRVDVERKVGKTSWNKINGFTISQGVDQTPKDDAEKITRMIVAIAMAHVDEEGADGVYRGKYYVVERGEPKRKHCSFRQRLGDEDSEPMRDGEFDEDETQRSSQVMASVFNQALMLINIQNAQIERQNDRILEASRMSTAQIQQLLSTHETLIEKYHEGLTMQANALTLMLDVERNMESEKQRGQNASKLIGLMEMALPTAITQFAKYAAQKKKDGDDEDEDETDEAENDNGEASGSESKEKEPEEKDLEREAMEKKIKEAPITTFAHAFMDSMSQQQLLDLAETLTKKQMGLLRSATSKETDPETAEAIIELQNALMKSPQTFLSLKNILSDKQVQMVMRLIQIAGEAKPTKKSSKKTKRNDDD